MRNANLRRTCPTRKSAIRCACRAPFLSCPDSVRCAEAHTLDLFQVMSDSDSDIRMSIGDGLH